MLRGDAEYLHNQGELLIFTFAWEDWNTSVELYEYAAEAPHINSSGVWNAKNDFGCPVEPGLDVSVNALIRKAG